MSKSPELKVGDTVSTPMGRGRIIGFAGTGDFQPDYFTVHVELFKATGMGSKFWFAPEEITVEGGDGATNTQEI